MIHTAQFYTNISFQEKQNIENKFNKNIEDALDEISKRTNGITITAVKKLYGYYLNIHLDVTKLLNKGNISELDYYKVQNKIDRFIKYIIGYNIELILIRIEYRIDIYIESESERYILMHLYKKLTQKHGFKKRINNIEYKTSINYKSGSIGLIIYDKNSERLSNNEKPKKYERNMIRYEVKVLNNHLNYNKNKYKTQKTLQNYFKEELNYNYMLKNIQKIVYKGDYYNIYIADKIINNSNLKEADKLLVREFLIDVSKFGITGAKLIKKKDNNFKYTSYKYNKIIALLEELNINPILIPKNFKCKNGKSYSHIKNPFNL